MDAAKIKYHQAGDYLLPNLKAPDNPNIGIWGMRRKEHLLKFKDPVYTGLFLSGKLNSHLVETDTAASVFPKERQKAFEMGAALAVR